MQVEEAQELLANVNGKIEMKRLEAVNLLFREIDELIMMEEDAQQYALKCRKELEALQSRSCEGCIYFNKQIGNGFCFRLNVYVTNTFFCQGHEPKEQ